MEAHLDVLVEAKDGMEASLAAKVGDAAEMLDLERFRINLAHIRSFQSIAKRLKIESETAPPRLPQFFAVAPLPEPICVRSG